MRSSLALAKIAYAIGRSKKIDPARPGLTIIERLYFKNYSTDFVQILHSCWNILEFVSASFWC